MNPVPQINLHRPVTLNEALGLLAELKSAKPIAGGTDLLSELRSGASNLCDLVDLGLIKELNYIREENGRINIGAMTTHGKIAASPLLKLKASVLCEAASLIGSVQIRNLATVGGNLCNASPGADTATPLLVLGAEAAIASKGKTRNVSLEELFIGPRKTSLISGELLIGISFPVLPKGSGGAFIKIGRRKGSTLSLINAAAYIEMKGIICTDARVAIGACAPTPLRIKEVEAMIQGNVIDVKLIERISSACYGLVQPSTREYMRASEEYRRNMSCVLIRRVLYEARDRAQRNM
jgi:CO/xanthine dehydrogenase FAD-binding subunit